MPKTKEQNQLIKQKRIEEIIKVSLYSFAIQGYAAVKIDTITKQAKCSHGLFYHYFKTKEDVFHAVMDYVIKEINKIQNSVNYEQKAKFALCDLIDAILTAIKSSDDMACMYYLLFNLHLQKQIIPKPLHPIERKRTFDLIYELIEKGQADKDFIKADPKELTVAILSMVKGLAYNRLYIGKNKFVCPDATLIMNLVSLRTQGGCV